MLRRVAGKDVTFVPRKSRNPRLGIEAISRGTVSKGLPIKSRLTRLVRAVNFLGKDRNWL